MQSRPLAGVPQLVGTWVRRLGRDDADTGSDGEDGIAAEDTALQDEDGSPVWTAVGIAAAVLVVLIVAVLLIQRRPNSSQ